MIEITYTLIPTLVKPSMRTDKVTNTYKEVTKTKNIYLTDNH